MLNLTAEAKKAWLAQTRQVNARVTIGTAVYNTDKIMSIEYDSGSISGETFQIGSFYQNSIKVVLVGILESLANDNKVRLEFAVKVGQAFEWVNMGTFYVTELDRDRNSNRTTFTAVDASVYLGKNYAPTISFPNSLKNLVTDIANQCGVQVNFASMTHLADVNVTQPPSKYTCRQVISMVAQIHGGFARINRNDQLEVTRLMSSDIELSPSHYLLKGLTKNETTYRTDGIIVKIGENEEDVLKVGTTTGSAVINLENPLMTQTLLDEMWRVVSIISYYPFNLKWRGIPNLEAGDWITIVDKQGTHYRVPNLSYKLSFKGGLSAESSANTTATSNVQHKLRGTLTQRVEDVEGYINATGGRSYTGLDVPDNKYLKKGDTWYKPDGDDTAILVYDGEKWEEVASPEVFRQLQADFEALDKQAKEAFEQVDTLVQESPETKRLAQEAQEAVNLANKEITKLQTSVSDTKTALQNAEQEFADSLATTTRELTAKISGIDVGGRNLLFKTGYFETSQLYGFAGDMSKIDLRISTVDDDTSPSGKAYLVSKHKKGTEDVEGGSYWYFTKKLTPGKKYTWSVYVKGVGTVKTVGQEQGGQKSIELTDTWTKISHTFTANDSRYKSFTFYSPYDFDLYFTDLMLEEGNKPSSWSPAPEDFEYDLSNTSIELSTKITESAAKLRTEMSEKYSTKNDLTTLSGEYNSFKEETAKKFSQQVSSIQTIQTDTTNAKQLANDAYNKAQNAVASATNANSTANSAVSTANTAKNNANKAIADVAALTKTVSSQSTRIDQTSNRIDLVASGITEVGNKLDNLQVGGRNILRGTKDMKLGSGKWAEGTWRQSNSGTTKNVALTDFPLANITQGIEITSDSSECGIAQDYLKLESGYYTLSYYIKAKTPNTKVLIQAFWNGTYYANKTYILNNTNWTRVSITGELKESQDSINAGYIYVLTPNATITVAAPFEHHSNKEGEWSPAPEDTQTQIDGLNTNLSNNYYQKTTVDSKLSTAVSGITAQYKQDINTKLGNYYDKSTIDSKLTIDGQGIATYVKSTQSQLDGLQVGGENLINLSEIKEFDGATIDTSNYIKRGEVILTKSTRPYCGLYFNFYNDAKPEKYYVLSYDITALDNEPFKTIRGHMDPGFYTMKWYVDGVETKKGYPKPYTFSDSSVKKHHIEVYIKVKNEMTADRRIFIQPNMNGTARERYKIENLKLVEGNKYTNGWSPAPGDMATLTQYTEVKQLADRISSTVYDSSTGLVTKTNQLAGKYAIQNLNSYGDVLSSLNLNGGNVRIKGSLIYLDGNVRIQDAFVTNLKANSILANEITAKATTIVNAKIANLDAGVITTGILKGTNLSLNLGTGEVQFQKGRIQAPNNTLDIQVNTGIMKVLNTKGEGVTFQNGNLYFSNATVQGYYGSLLYNSSIDGAVNGVRINGLGGVVLASKSQKGLILNGSFSDIKNGASLNLIEHSDGKGYAYLLSQNSITIAVNKKRESTFGYDFTGINIYKETDGMQLTAGTISTNGDIMNLSSNIVNINSGKFYSYAKEVTFNYVTNFRGNVNFTQKVNDNYLALCKSSKLIFDVKGDLSSPYLEVTQGLFTYKIPLK